MPPNVVCLSYQQILLHSNGGNERRIRMSANAIANNVDQLYTGSLSYAMDDLRLSVSRLTSHTKP